MCLLLKEPYFLKKLPFLLLLYIIEWNKIDKNTRKTESLNIFKNDILKFMWPSQNIVYNCHNNPKGIKLLTIFRVVLSQLRAHKFKHSLQYTLNLICDCGEKIETSSHYLFHCPEDYLQESMTLLNKVRCIIHSILHLNNA